MLNEPRKALTDHGASLEFIDGLNYTTIIEPAGPLAGRRGSGLRRQGIGHGKLKKCANWNRLWKPNLLFSRCENRVQPLELRVSRVVRKPWLRGGGSCPTLGAEHQRDLDRDGQLRHDQQYYLCQIPVASGLLPEHRQHGASDTQRRHFRV